MLCDIFTILFFTLSYFIYLYVFFFFFDKKSNALQGISLSIAFLSYFFFFFFATVYKCPLILLSPLWQMPLRHQVALASAIPSGIISLCIQLYTSTLCTGHMGEKLMLLFNSTPLQLGQQITQIRKILA